MRNRQSGCKTQSTPPQSPSRSVKSQSLSQSLSRSSVQDRRGALTFQPKKCNDSDLRLLTPLPPFPPVKSYAHEDRMLWAQYGCKYVPQEKNHHHNHNHSPPSNDLIMSKKGSAGRRMTRCSLLRFILRLSVTVFVSGIVGALSGIYFLQFLKGEWNSSNPSLPSTDVLRLDKSGNTEAQMEQLMISMEGLAGQLKTLQDRLSHSQKTCSDVEIKPQRELYEGLFEGEPDLACAGNFGTVLATPDTSTLTVAKQLSFLSFHWLSFSLQLPHRPPYTTIKGSIPEMGDCWGFLGQKGRLVLALHRPSQLTAVSLSQLPANLMPYKDMDSAPRHFMVLAHKSEEDLENALLLGEFEYIRTGPWRQTFTLDPLIAKEKLRLIEFRFFSNYGHPDHTCVYRVHIHGTMT